MMQIGGSSEWAKLAGKPPEVEGAETVVSVTFFVLWG